MWPDPKIFFLRAASVGDAAVFNPYGIKTLLANDLSKVFINDNPAFSSGPRTLPKNPPDCHILSNWVCHNFISADETFWTIYEA